MRLRTARRAFGSVLVAVLSVGAAAPMGAMALADPPDWASEVVASTPDDDPVAPPFPAGSESAPPVEDEGVPEGTAVSFPAPGLSEVVLGETGAGRGGSDSPIVLVPTSEAAHGADLSVEILDASVAEQAGASGFVFRIDGGDGESLSSALAEAAGEAGSGQGVASVELTLDYSGFAERYGAGYVDRMRLVALPDCALSDPLTAGCDRDGVALAQHVNLETGELVAEIEDLEALESTTLVGDLTDFGAPVQVDDRSGVTVTPRPVAEDAGAEPTPAAAASGAEVSEPVPPTTTFTTTSTSTTSTSTTSTTAPPVSTSIADPDVMDDPEGTAGVEGGAAAAVPDASTTTTVPASSSTTTEAPLVDAPTTSTSVPAEELSSRESAEDEALAVVQAESGGVVLALMSGVSGEAGTFAATPLSISHEWQVGIGSGEFSWSYPIPMPEAPAGETPSLGLSYSSGAVDGMVTTRNSQSGPAGLGWGGFGSSFIERRYIPCVEEDPTLTIGDLCWKEDNATISLNGVTSELIRVPGVWGWTYRLKNDPGWRVDKRNSFVPNGDNDGENWVVTTPDGTEYWFGYGVNPEANNAPTNSAWTVPVFGNGVGTDPCTASGGGIGWCNQAWRWNLDRVVDPNGNVTNYTYWVEQNKYGILNGWSDASYTRGGRLHYIEYGLRDGSSAAGSAKVVLDAQYRCGYLVPACPAPVPGVGGAYPDVPSDLICASNCLVNSPTFFDAYRYTKVTTYTRGTGAYQPVNEVTLAHGWQNDGEGNLKLWLLALQRTGLVGGNLSMPAVNFLPLMKNNRVDYNLALGVSPMRHPRIGVIVDEYGARTDIVYAQPNPCSANPYPNGGWDTNAKDCFPQKWTPNGSNPGFGIFHKYVTGTVTTTDTLGGSPPVTAQYIYEGGAAWHHDADDWVGLQHQSWSDWRGYGDVIELNGTGTPLTKYRVFRGMNSDRLAGGGVKTVYITPLSGGGGRADDQWLAGRVLETQDFASNWTTVLSSTLTDHVTEVTANPGTNWQEWALWTDVSTTTLSERTPLAGFVTQQEVVTYDANFQPVTQFESGWTNASGDERCTVITYATNPLEGMVSYPASEKLVAGTCNSSEVLAETEWYYDGTSTLGALGATGNLTQTRARVDATSWSPFETMTYDALGRPASVTNALGATTSTVHTPATGYPASTTVTNPLGHTSTTAWQIQRGLPVSETDPNGKVTSYAYDPLNRLLRVRQPTEQVAGSPVSFEFFYDIAVGKDDEPMVRTRQLTSADGTRFEDSWVIYDTMLRERQTQELSPVTGKVVVSETVYDGRGLVAASRAPQAVTGTAGDRIGNITWDNSITYVHDELGRLTEERYLRGSTQAWVTQTAYTHNTIEVTPPEGGRTLSVLDAYGRTVRIEEHDGTDWQPTVYGHDLAGNLVSVTDPAGNEITYDYDMIGRRTSQDDPDSGAASYGYDAVGNQTRLVDATGTEIHTLYDAVSRPIERHEDSPTGDLLVSWAYDTLAKGQLDSSTRHTAAGDWTTSVVGYDDRGRPTATSLTVPAGVAGLTGTYTTGYTYDRADRIIETAYPAVGDLPAETVTTTYNTVGLPESMIGAEEYVWGMTYDDRGRPSVRSSGDRTSWIAQSWTYDADQRLDRLQGATPVATLMDHEFGYDKVGNITERNTTLSGASWRECFEHDERQRLTDAFTVDASAACDVGQRGMGDVGYEHTYEYSDDGNLISRTEDGETRDYTYPTGGAGSVRPHAATEVGDDDYEWDANGNLSERTVDGNTDTYSWSAERLLESVTGAGGTTSFTYGPGGERLLVTTPGGANTLYLDGHEVKANPDGSVVAATRTYSFGGQLIATRTIDGVDYLLADQQGSIEISIPSGASTADAARTYLPYGEARSGDGTGFDTDRGWLGQVEDESTDLSFLNARYYDSNMSQFISADPLYDQARPQSLNPYAYGLGSPATNTDASGLMTVGGKKGGKILGKGRGKVGGSKIKKKAVKARPVAKKAVSAKRATKVMTKAVRTPATAWPRLSNKDRKALRAMHAACPTAACAAKYRAHAVASKAAAALAGAAARELANKKATANTAAAASFNNTASAYLSAEYPVVTVILSLWGELEEDWLSGVSGCSYIICYEHKGTQNLFEVTRLDYGGGYVQYDFDVTPHSVYRYGFGIGVGPFSRFRGGHTARDASLNLSNYEHMSIYTIDNDVVGFDEFWPCVSYPRNC